MSDPKSAAIAFEGVKVSMSQTKDGIKITFVVHPNDDTQDLFNHPVGSRYQVVVVQVDDENQPIAPARRTEGERAVTAAIMLCREAAFQQWLFDEDRIMSVSEELATHELKQHCGIQSRAELKTNEEARAKFDQLRLMFSQRRVR